MRNYTLEIIHHPGTKMVNADALSRCHEILALEVNTFDQLLALKKNLGETIVDIKNDLQVKENNFVLTKGRACIFQRKRKISLPWSTNHRI